LPAYAVTGTVDVRVGKQPGAVAVNSKTNKIYVANKQSNTVTIIDGQTNRTKTVKTGPEPIAVKVNQLTNRIYVLTLRGLLADGSIDFNGAGTVAVIDGETDKVIKKVPCQLEPYALAINEKTNKVYVANQGSNSVTMIDGRTNRTATVQLRPDDADSIYDGVLSPQDIAVNEVTNKIYVTGTQSNTVAVIDGKTLRHTVVLTEGGGTTSQSGLTPTFVGINPKTNMIYTSNFTSNDVTVIDGKTNKKIGIISLVDVQDPYSITVNPNTNKIYTANLTSRSITVIDGETEESITIGDLPGKPFDVAINMKTNKIYFPSFVLYRGSQVGDDKQITGVILELDGATNKLTTIVAGITPYAVAVNENTNKVYVTNFDSGTVTVLTPQ
jgi:YVTN family beta-propeller protein